MPTKSEVANAQLEALTVELRNELTKVSRREFALVQWAIDLERARAWRERNSPTAAEFMRNALDSARVERDHYLRAKAEEQGE